MIFTNVGSYVYVAGTIVHRSKLLSQKSRAISCNLEVDDHYLDPTFLYYRPEGTRFHSSVGSKQVRSQLCARAFDLKVMSGL